MRSAFLAAAAVVACSGREIPRGVTAIDVPVVFEDIVFSSPDVIDAGALSDSAAIDAPDAASAMETGASDATSPADAPRDAGTDADVGTPVNRLCGFEEGQINAVAVKLATCFNLPPQRLMEQLWRPEAWEGGQQYTSRVCDVYRLCVGLSSTRGCSAVLNTCLKIAVTPAPNGSCDGVAPSCNGVRLRTCASGLIRDDSCQAAMRECVASSGQGACAQPLAPPCAEGAPPRCEGDVLQRCVAGRYVATLDCGRSGAVCDATADACVGGGEPCTGEGATCDGTVLVRCRGGRRQRIDCGLNVRGASCRAMGAEAFCGVALDCDPARAPSTGTCEGANLSLCAGGRTYRFDCAAMGFGTCGTSGCVP